MTPNNDNVTITEKYFTLEDYQCLTLSRQNLDHYRRRFNAPGIERCRKIVDKLEHKMETSIIPKPLKDWIALREHIQALEEQSDRHLKDYQQFMEGKE